MTPIFESVCQGVNSETELVNPLPGLRSGPRFVSLARGLIGAGINLNSFLCKWKALYCKKLNPMIINQLSSYFSTFYMNYAECHRNNRVKTCLELLSKTDVLYR